jgi:uncharacterized protein (TIGR02452 family)
MDHVFVQDTELQDMLRAANAQLPARSSGAFVSENQALTDGGGFTIPDGNGRWQAVPPAPESDRVQYAASAEEGGAAAKYPVTKVCCANVDTLTAALLVPDCLALNFANAGTPGGGYLDGCRAQEEDLCRLLPQLYPALAACKYPIEENEAIVTRNLLAVRRPNSYDLMASMGTVNVVTAAMPSGIPLPSTPEWTQSVKVRMRTVLSTAKRSELPNLILGAWGCGDFGNQPDQVARLFWEQLESPEYRGCFETVVFAIFAGDSIGSGNLWHFYEEMKAHVFEEEE